MEQKLNAFILIQCELLSLNYNVLRGRSEGSVVVGGEL